MKRSYKYNAKRSLYAQASNTLLAIFKKKKLMTYYSLNKKKLGS